MKKVISILLVIFMMFTTIVSYAADENNTVSEETTANIEFDLTGTTEIEEGTNSVVLKISLGEFTEVEEGQPLGFEGQLIYDEEMFSNASVQGLNGWSVSYVKDTNVLMGDIATAKSNTDIAEITLTINDNLEVGASGKVELQDILLTDDTNDFTFNKEVTLSIVEKVVDEEESIIESVNEVQNEEQNNADSNNINGVKDNTTATKSIPKAGITSAIIIACLIVLLVGIANFVRYKSIKIK